VILVVGATGQVGGLVVRRLREQGHEVRALVRAAGSAATDVAGTGAQLALGDLRDPASLARAVRGARAIVATANVVAPTQRGDTHDAVERRGYGDLIGQAEQAGVGRFVFSSVPVTPLDDQVPQFAAKRHIENLLAASSMSTLSLRLAPFTEVWLALVGSEVPLRGEAHPTLDRAYPFLRTFRRVSGRTVERQGRFVVPGPATNRNAFISVHDVAELLAAAVDRPSVAGSVDVGGPEVLSWNDAARIYAEVLHRPVQVVSIPARAFEVPQRLLSPVAPAAANIMGLNRAIATMTTDWDTSAVTGRLGLASLRTVRQVLADKAAMPAAKGTR
jgi:uncharacterized protein YbjT (DUF2867 family)